jgi:hypothetical protein
MQTSFASLKPYSRDSLRVMKSQKDEEERVKNVNNTILSIYNSALQVATTTTDTSYKYAIQRDHIFIMTNMADILSGLQRLFPDCSVEQKSLVRMHDGKYCEMPPIDDKLLPFMNMKVGNTKQECIVIDWS